MNIYETLFRSHLEYGSAEYGHLIDECILRMWGKYGCGLPSYF